MKKDEIDRIIEDAVQKAFGIRPRYENECDFKYELFHQLAISGSAPTPLAAKGQGFSTCILHAEGKPENGNASKADLLLCDPNRKQRFNYHVEAIIELKEKLMKPSLTAELAKWRRYNEPRPHLYLVSANPGKALDSQVAVACSGVGCRILTREQYELSDSQTMSEHAVGGDASIVDESIREALSLYGEGRNQYHGFYWCNYEHEQTKGWTFPCEGDFTAQLYHRIRTRDPSLDVHAEVCPVGTRSRVDLFVGRKVNGSVCIEIEMNWDQFKPKFRKRMPFPSEAASIQSKFLGLSSSIGPRHRNILVVIQGVDGHKSDHKERALGELKRPRVPFDLFYYDENADKAMGPVRFV